MLRPVRICALLTAIAMSASLLGACPAKAEGERIQEAGLMKTEHQCRISLSVAELKEPRSPRVVIIVVQDKAGECCAVGLDQGGWLRFRELWRQALRNPRKDETVGTLPGLAGGGVGVSTFRLPVSPAPIIAVTVLKGQKLHPCLLSESDWPRLGQIMDQTQALLDSRAPMPEAPSVAAPSPKPTAGSSVQATGIVSSPASVQGGYLVHFKGNVETGQLYDVRVNGRHAVRASIYSVSGKDCVVMLLGGEVSRLSREDTLEFLGRASLPVSVTEVGRPHGYSSSRVIAGPIERDGFAGPYTYFTKVTNTGNRTAYNVILRCMAGWNKEIDSVRISSLEPGATRTWYIGVPQRGRSNTQLMTDQVYLATGRYTDEGDPIYQAYRLYIEVLTDSD